MGLPDIGFMGKPGAGKHSAIRYLTEDQGYNRPGGPYAVICLNEEGYWNLKGVGFVIVRIEAHADTRRRRMAPLNLQHNEDTEHLKADYTISNDSSLYDLGDGLVKILERERKRR